MRSDQASLDGIDRIDESQETANCASLIQDQDVRAASSVATVPQPGPTQIPAIPTQIRLPIKVSYS